MGFRSLLTNIKVYACYTVKIYKNKPVNFFKTGGGGVDPGSAFDLYIKV